MLFNFENLINDNPGSRRLRRTILVISDSTKIEISVSGREDFHLLSIDAKIYTLKNETKIFLEKANFDIQVANINNYNFYKTLKDKLLWGKDKRN